MRTTSLKSRLLVLLITLITCGWLLIAFYVHQETKHEISELFDANLAQSANVIYQLLAHEILEHHHLKSLSEPKPIIYFKVHYDRKVAFLIRDLKGNLIAKSTHAPLFSIPQTEQPAIYQDIQVPPLSPVPQIKQPAIYQDVQIDKYWWRVFTLKTPYGILQVAERKDIRGELIKEIIWQMLRILLWSLPFLTILTYVSIRHGLKPLQRIANDIAQRSPEQLQLIDNKDIPLEIKSLVDTLNNLFQRLNQTFENERRFTADAAHELRTPLAGLKLQAEIALQNPNNELRSQALQNILIGVEQAHHLVVQLLTLARIDGDQHLEMKTIDLKAIVEKIIKMSISQAIEKQQDFGLTMLTNDTQIQGNPEALEILLRNLVDNALRYTPDNGEITISIERLESKQLCLKVKDNGDGIPQEKISKIFERFYRGEHQHIQGSGLGLSIVKRVVELHHLHLHLENNAGLLVVVIFP
jgi:two-component system, OmpR family, sensor histidine kinase QseC